MSEEIKNNEPQQQPTQPADNGNSGGEKMFTQDEVNRIVSDRLARDREKRSTPQDDTKELALKARESKLDCREYLSEKKYPVELLEVLDTSDVDKFKATTDKLWSIYGMDRPRFADPKPFDSPNGVQQHLGTPDRIRDAFKPPKT